jgi:hypothetical protein
MLASRKEYVQKEFAALDEEGRVNATRGVIVDFAMISGMWRWKEDAAPEATVCTIKYVIRIAQAWFCVPGLTVCTDRVSANWRR